MKRITIVLLALVFGAALSASAFAYTPSAPMMKGSILFAAMDVISYQSFSGSLYRGEQKSEFSFNYIDGAELYLQYFIIPHLAIGGTFIYDSTDYRSGNKDDNVTKTGGGPIVSYYLPFSPQLVGNITGYYLYATNDESFDGGGSTTTKITAYGARVGINYFLITNFAVSLEAGYSWDKQKNSDAHFNESGHTTSISLSFKVFL